MHISFELRELLLNWSMENGAFGCFVVMLTCFACRLVTILAILSTLHVH